MKTVSNSYEVVILFNLTYVFKLNKKLKVEFKILDMSENKVFVEYFFLQKSWKKIMQFLSKARL